MAITVNSEIKRILREKDAAIRTGTSAMLGTLKELQKQVNYEISKAATGSWDAYQFKQLSSEIGSQILNYQAKAQAEAAGLLKELWGLGQTLVDAPLAVDGIYTGFHLSTSVLDTWTDFTFHKIKGFSGALTDKINGELTLGLLGGKTPAEVAKAIGMNLKDSGIFRTIAARAETITQTEMGRVFSQATQLRLDQTAAVVPGMEKQWIHAGHPFKARASHVAAHGQHVAYDKPFNIGGTMMMFPRAPEAPLEEVIHCGCVHVPYNARWK